MKFSPWIAVWFARPMQFLCIPSVVKTKADSSQPNLLSGHRPQLERNTDLALNLRPVSGDQCSLSAAGSLLRLQAKADRSHFGNSWGWFSASKTYATSQQPNCASAVEAKAGLFSAEKSI
jgi:hypothetical protein